MRDDLELRVLGPLGVIRGGTELTLGGRRQRLVLALLLLEPGRVVPADRLVDRIWGGTVPATGTGPLRTYVWQLRRLLADPDGGEDAADRRPPLVWRDAGYLLDVDPMQLDSVRFERLVAEARRAAADGDPLRARRSVDEARALWRGPAYGELAAETALQGEATRLDQLLLEAEELRAELLLATGEHRRAAAEVGALARAHPQRERLWAVLMTALYRSGRQGEALRCYQDARTLLVETMGIEPGPALRDLEQAILRQDPALDPPALPDHPPRETADRAVGTAPPPTGPDGMGARLVPSANGTPPHNLPRGLTSFVGRRAERAAVAQALDGSRLVTLAGSPGCGKTRLALAVAESVLPRFPGGVGLVDVAAVVDAEGLARAVGTSLAVPPGPSPGPGDRPDVLADRIADQRVLLVLDDCERLVGAVAALVEALLARCPELHVLATSREELRIGVEVVWRVPGLALPPTGGDGDGTPPVADAEAVQLFVERCRSAIAGFAPDGEALEAVAEICRRLDGMPLAIELAAALAGSLPVTDIARRLDDRFPLLTEGRHQRLPRHRSLRAALDWSFDLLDRPTQLLLARLGVFAGDFCVAAAEAVAGAGTAPLTVARGLGRLVRASMLDPVPTRDGTQRYRLLETTRLYALDRLRHLGEADATRRRHARFHADLAAEAERQVHGPAAAHWLARIVADLPDLRSALAWAFTHDDVETGLRLAGSLPWFLTRMAPLDDIARWLESGLARPVERPPALHLKALTAASSVAFLRGEFSRTHDLGEESIALARRLDDGHQLAMAVVVRGAAAVYEGDLDRAEECFEEAHQLCQRLGDRWGSAWLLTLWATSSSRSDPPERARQQLEEALEIFHSLGDRHGQTWPLVNLALGAMELALPDEALCLARAAAQAAATAGDDLLRHVTLCVQGRAELALGHREQATTLLLRSLDDTPRSRTRVMVAAAVDGLAELAALAGHPDDATALAGFAQQMRRRWQITPSPTRAHQLDEWLASMAATLGPERLKLALDRGRVMELDEAIRLARATAAAGAVARAGPG